MRRSSVSSVVAFLLLAGAVMAQTPPDPTAVAGGSSAEADQFYGAIRANDLGRLERLLKSGADPNVRDTRGGATPLMYAAGIGSVDAMNVLLAHKADVHRANSSGATALMWAGGNLDKVRLLLSRGADAKAASQRGRTALYIAAKHSGAAPVVKLLLEAGADPNAADEMKATPLQAAASADDIESIRLLVAAGADVNAADFGGFTPLINAASNTNLEAVKLLLAKGADVNARSADGSFQKVKAGTISLGHWTPLLSAAAYGSPALIATLLDAGAQVNVTEVRRMTPLMLAVATDNQNPEVIRLLLAKGADVNARSKAGETALDWARKIGDPRAIEMLRSAGGAETPTGPIAVPPAAPIDLKASIERSLSLLRSMSVTSAANGGCASCHSHNIVDMAEGAARTKGLSIDMKVSAQRQTLTKARYFSLTNLLERFDSPVPEIEAYAMLALHGSGQPPDRTTDGMSALLMAHQRANGAWSGGGAIARPPIEDGDIFRTALAVRAISLYAPPARAIEAKARAGRARTWLAAARPRTAEDRNMQLLGLFWAGAGSTDRARLAKAILAKQRPDGGWSQTDHLASDAYATGQSLYALAEAGGIAPDNAAFKKGVEYLLSTQRADGSWYVKSRAPKFQPFFDGGFPYGHDQWISEMATGWAVAGLTHALPPVDGRKTAVASR